MSLPEDFLTQLEQYRELSTREREVFLEIFARGKSRVEVTLALVISESNVSSCLTGIYKKFRISGSGPVKERNLREYLQKRYETHPVETRDINTLALEIRNQIKPNIRERCGTMRVLDMTQPIELTGEGGIYTHVNILENISGRRRLTIEEIYGQEGFDIFLFSDVPQKRVPGIEVVQQYSKLMVLGKPGAGKTTFLKYLAMQCIDGGFLSDSFAAARSADRTPIFITLKDFAEAPGQPDLLNYICQSTNLETRHFAALKNVIAQGKTFILLDGLDEVREEDSKRVIKQIRDFSDLYHTNQFVITCRIAAKEYIFEKFTEVEVADFDKQQIAIFAQKWFRGKDSLPRGESSQIFLSCQGGNDGGKKAERFIQKLKASKPIFALATNPLLLTLLCLVFGESNDFPANRSELYKEGLDVLLKKWDAKRNIERDVVYKQLSLPRKEDLLSQIALTTFEYKEYFFKQKKVEAYIADFLHNLRDARTAPEDLERDSEAVLKSIEAQHGLLVERARGIYSFSHLTFHEYFAAREIVANSAYEMLG